MLSVIYNVDRGADHGGDGDWGGGDGASMSEYGRMGGSGNGGVRSNDDNDDDKFCSAGMCL